MPLTDTTIKSLDEQTRKDLYIYLFSKIHQSETIRKEKHREKIIDGEAYIDIVNELLLPLTAKPNVPELIYSRDLEKAKNIRVKKVNFQKG